MEKRKHIALVAHDHRKKDLVEWVEWNYDTLVGHHLVATGTTGGLLDKVLEGIAARSGDSQPEPLAKLRSGPLGGDLQLGAMIAEGRIDILIFFWDPMEPQPHDVDVKALLRIAVVWNIPIACNRASADFMISSPLIAQPYERKLKDWTEYLQRPVD